MFCSHCGKEIEEGVRFCKYCGQPVILAQKNGPEEGRQQREEVRRENYIAPAGLKEKKKKTNDNSLTILLGVIAAVLFVTLGFLVYRIFLADPVTGGKKEPSAKETAVSAESGASQKTGSGSGISGTAAPASPLPAAAYLITAEPAAQKSIAQRLVKKYYAILKF